MQISFQINTDLEADTAGELFLSFLNPTARWGYSTHEILNNLYTEEQCTFEDDKVASTLCCGVWAKQEAGNIRKVHLPLMGLEVFLFWDGDGTIVFHHIEEDWYLYNDDCKKSYGWHWADENDWVWQAVSDEDYFEDAA